MANTYYDSELTSAEIDRALKAIGDVVAATNNGKVLCITDGAIDAKSASTWGGGGYPEPTGTLNIIENGLVNVKDYAEANVQVSGGSAVLLPLSVTQNDTYNPPSGVDGFSSVTVNVSGGGGSGLEEYWDLTDSLVGENGLTADVTSVTIDASGALFPVSGALRVPLLFYSKPRTIEVETGNLNLTSGSHRRFIMFGEKNTGNGFIYRSSGVWAFYNNSWVESDIRDATYFDNCTVRVVSDNDNYWHIYKDGVLVWEPSLRAAFGYYVIGSTSGGLQNSIIKSIRAY